MTPDVISVLIADDEPVVRDALGDLIAEGETTRLAGMAADGDEAIRLCGELRPDVILLDVRMPHGGPEAVEAIHRAAPDTKVVVLSAYADHPTVMEMVRAGASGYLVKSGPVARILDAIDAAASGGGVLSDEVAPDVLAALTGYLAVDDDERATRVRRVERIRAAIDGAVVGIVFQPIVDLSDRRVGAIEALSRFAHHDSDSLGRDPSLWFAEAWEVGLGVELELAAAQRALRRVGALPAGVRLAVNLSPLTVLSPSFAGLMADIPGFDSLVIELTEHAPVDDYECLAVALRDFRDGGGQIAVDDVGAGFASLRHILGIAPDVIKLDVTLTRGIDSDPSKRALATALVSFAGSIGSVIVAEGIETGDEEQTLLDLGVGFGQGFALAMPEPEPRFGVLTPG